MFQGGHVLIALDMDVFSAPGSYTQNTNTPLPAKTLQHVLDLQDAARLHSEAEVQVQL